MKILTLNFNLKGIGTYRRCFYFSRELARSGHEVTMFTVSRSLKYLSRTYYKNQWLGESELPIKPFCVKVIESPYLGYKWLPGWGSGPLDIFSRLHHLLFDKVDAVIGFEYQPNVSWPVYATRHIKKYRFISDWCDWFAGQSNQLKGYKLAHKIDQYFEEKIRHASDKLSVTSTVLERRAVDIGIDPGRIVKIPEGAATDYIKKTEKKSARSILGLPLDTILVVSVREGNMVKEVSIFSKFLKKYPDSKLLLVGNPAKEASGLAEKLGINDKVINTGWVDDQRYPLFLSAADIALCPLEDNLNNCARWPAKILDYLTAGKPVITNDVGEVGELFKSREVGVLATHDENDFVNALCKLLSDNDRLNYLGQNARKVMEEEWDWQVRNRLITNLVGT